MRICFIGDSSSIHVQRQVSYHLSKQDEVLVLSSAPYISDITGASVLYALYRNHPAFAISYELRRPKRTVTSFLKYPIPIDLKLLAIDTLRGVLLFRRREFCLTQVQNFNPDVIVCHRSFPEGLLLPYFQMYPILLRTAGSDVSKLSKYPLYKQVIRRILRSADLIVTESFWEKRLLLQLGGPSLNPEVNVIGVDTTLFREPISKDVLRNRYGFPQGAFIIVCNRSLHGVYNGWSIVEAVQEIYNYCPNLFLFYASPSRLDPRTQKRIRTIASRYPRISFLDQRVAHSEVPNILGCGDIYISFSSYDGIPNSLLEAMACGVVPIVAELPQLHEWINDNVTGFFVPQRDKVSLASRICSIYRNPEDLSKMSIRCIAEIRNRAEFKERMRRTRIFLRELVIDKRNHSAAKQGKIR